MVRLHGAPGIINTDQGSKFTSDAFVAAVAESGARLSMKGKDTWTENIVIERLWLSLKYEVVYVRAYDTVADAKAVGRPIDRKTQHNPTLRITGRQNTRNYSQNKTNRLTAHGIIGTPANTLIFERKLLHKPEPSNPHTGLHRCGVFINT